MSEDRVLAIRLRIGIVEHYKRGVFEDRWSSLRLSKVLYSIFLIEFFLLVDCPNFDDYFLRR